jgi:hypothetical protein
MAKKILSASAMIAIALAGVAVAYFIQSDTPVLHVWQCLACGG